MNYLKAFKEITEIIPDIKYELEENKIKSHYYMMRIFTDHIKKMIWHNERSLLFKSLKKINIIYKNGDTMLKNAVEYTFIYSLDNMTALCSKEYRNIIFSHISGELQKAYSRQIYSHGL